jgi:hypothetical protein
MSEVSRPLQVVLVLTAAFAGLWFVALRPKPGAGTAPATQPATHPAQPAPKKSSLPGGLGRAVDKANATKRQGDAAAAASDSAGAAPETPTTSTPASSGSAPTPQTTVPATPAARIGQSVAGSGGANAAANAGAVAVGMAGAAVVGSLDLPTPAGAAAPRATPRAAAHGMPSVTPGMVRHALARGDVVVLLFWGANGADDRAVRAELSQVDPRGGRVHAWPVAVQGLSRFKNVLRGIDVLQSPTVVVLARGADPRVLAGYTDHAEIDQATLLALSRR